MREYFNRLRSIRQRYNTLVDMNRDAVDSRNTSMLRLSLICGVIIFALTLLVSFFVPLYSYLTNTYIAVLLLFAALLALLKYVKKIPLLVMVYLVYTALILYSSITSAFISPTYVCVTILAFLFQFPILYVDKSFRINIATALSALLYLAVIYPYKDRVILVDEFINVLAFAILASFIGTYTRRAMLENFDLKRSLYLSAYTDQLTGIANRRKFFERLADCEKADCEQPITALAMLDLDDFKSYNDTYGHQAGDECLRALGQCFQEYEAEYELVFYRYGGEEFVVASCIYSKEELFGICERLRVSVSEIVLSDAAAGARGITISIGVAALSDCANEGAQRKYGTLISMADSALYAAKDAGKNQIVGFSSALFAASEGQTHSPSFRLREG